MPGSAKLQPQNLKLLKATQAYLGILYQKHFYKPYTGCDFFAARKKWKQMITENVNWTIKSYKTIDEPETINLHQLYNYI